MLMMKENTLQQVQDLTTTFLPDVLMPSTEADIKFSPSSDIDTVCKNYGVLIVPKVDPSKCYATGVGEKSSACLHLVNVTGGPCEEVVKSIKCELVSEIYDTKVQCHIERKGLSEYKISYQPATKGKHQLHICVNGQNIGGSPYRVSAVPPPIKQLGTLIFSIKEVQEPWAIAIDQQGCLIVTEYGRNCVSVFTPRGMKIKSFGKPGIDHVEFTRPSGVTVDDKGNILVADDNNRIQKLDEEGNFLQMTFLDCKNIRGITFNAFNKRIYVTGDDCVQVLNSDLTLFDKLGGFFSPNGIACDSTGKVYVADSGNNRIRVFTPEGRGYSMFASCGTSRDSRSTLKFPVGIAVNSHNQVYVCEHGNHYITVFNTEGHFLTSFGGNIGICPRGLAVDESGVVYVCDYSNSTIHLF